MVQGILGLGHLQEYQKRINCVWIGDGQINHLSCFNILSWIACGWPVTIYRHSASSKPLWPENAKRYMEDVSQLTIVPLKEHIQAASPRMPSAAQKLLGWMEMGGRGYINYAIGDLTKSFVASTTHGVVLDLKIGPSKWIFEFPAEPFLDKVVSFSRAGALSVENQCIGYLGGDVEDNPSVKKYRTLMDKFAASSLGGYDFESKTGAEACFGAITGAHQRAFGVARGYDIQSERRAPFEFDELVAGLESEAPVRSRGPFRVYQFPGYFSWRQGEYADNATRLKRVVAATLEADHGGAVAEPPSPFSATPFYRDRVRPVARLAIAELS